MQNKVFLLRKIGIAEGISFLVLLFIAMPLKYYFNQPLTVKIIGWLHGILFIAFISFAWEVKSERNKHFKWFAIAFVASIIPTGTFFFDRLLKKELTNS